MKLVTIGEFRSNITGGLLNIINTELKISNKFPWCVATFNFKFSQSSGIIRDQQNRSFNTNMVVIPWSVSLNFKGIPLTRGVADDHNYTDIPGREFKISLILPIEAINFVERNRNDDITFEVNLSVAYREDGTLNNQIWQQDGTADFKFPLEYSAKKWNTLLSQMGYNEKWMIELDRPKLEGYKEVMEHINKAQDALYNKKEPEDVLRDLRAARDSFKTFYETNKEEINRIIDKGSIGEEKQKSKSQRVSELFDKIAYFLNIGPHNDKYEVTYLDAQFAFREFVSILSYLSHMLNQVGS